ncbi:MAG: Gfo/Idh/MocA family oxidoreductase [Bacteroidetes bacterium]|nr:MAG: Gfo/Idh/MocA family oxidoreductase [Bacteroidota bacterium]
MQKLQFAIIGCGKIAIRHAEQAAKHGSIAGVCDIINERADELASKFNTQAYYSIEDLFTDVKNIDITAICTPNGLHTEHSIMALNAKSNVLCEKPMSISGHSAIEMMQAADTNNKKLFVVKSTRYNPALAELKKIIIENKLGKLFSFQLNCFWNRPKTYYNDWRGTLKLDGGTLYTQFSHYIDAMLWLFGDVKSINGFRKNMYHKDVIEFEDTGSASLEMENGMIGGLNWSVNTFEKNMEVSLTLIGEKGSVRIAGSYMNKIEYQHCDATELKNIFDGAANDYGFYKGSMSNHDKVYENMLIAMNDNTHPFSNAVDGLKTVELIERIYQTIPLS